MLQSRNLHCPDRSEKSDTHRRDDRIEQESREVKGLGNQSNSIARAPESNHSTDHVCL